MVLEDGFNTAAIFSDIDTSGRGIFSYNASSMSWQQLNRTSPLTPTGSLWIYSAGVMQVPLYFSNNQTKGNVTLIQGWNGFGITGNSSAMAKSAFSPLGGNWAFVIGFNSLSQQYEPSIINGGRDRIAIHDRSIHTRVLDIHGGKCDLYTFTVIIFRLNKSKKGIISTLP